uniref:PDZ domain-containing protein n=1 Tax=Ascaris lumbricoides TaxID=6252 RepID=A0A0M3HQ08_ASCLU
MVEYDLMSLKSTDCKSTEQIMQDRSATHTFRFRLQPDTSVHGALAFRLIGNRTHGVFVCGVNEQSEQSKLLKNGDRILEVGGIDVRRLTCDQVASILRLSMIKHGYASLRVIHDREVQLLLKAHTNTDDDSSTIGTCALKRCYSSHCTEPPVQLRTSTSDVTGFADLNYEAAKIRPWRTQDDFGDAEYVHLICFDELSGKVFSHCKRKRTYEGSMQLDGDCAKLCNVPRRCSVCFKVIRRKRWHMLKHEWTLGARKLLPRSASGFFDLEKQANVHYTLL